MVITNLSLRRSEEARSHHSEKCSETSGVRFLVERKVLYCRHSVFCSGHILAVCKKGVTYDISQMPEFTQHVVGKHIIGGQCILIW